MIAGRIPTGPRPAAVSAPGIDSKEAGQTARESAHYAARERARPVCTVGAARSGRGAHSVSERRFACAQRPKIRAVERGIFAEAFALRVTQRGMRVQVLAAKGALEDLLLIPQLQFGPAVPAPRARAIMKPQNAGPVLPARA